MVEPDARSEMGQRYRHLPIGWKILTVTFSFMALVQAIFHLFGYRPFGFILVDTAYLYVLIATLLPLCFIWIPAISKYSRESVPFYDMLLTLASVGIPLFFIFHVMKVIAIWEAGAPPLPMALGFVLWLVVIEAARRTGGLVFAIFALLFSFYPLFGSYMPGILWAPNVSFSRLISFHSFGDSLMGTPIRVFGSIMVGFMVYAVVVKMVGAGIMFNDLSLALVGRSRAGIAKVATVSSGLFGSISGVSMANVFVTGSFTIPAMKREGMPSYMAAGVEAVASTGGILMPPVMGSVAFIMAEFMGVPYPKIAIAAVVPAILYYLCIFAHIDAHAARIGMQPTPITVNVPPVWRTIVLNFHMIISFVVLILMIFFLRNVSQAPWIASVIAIGLGMFRKETRLTLRHLVNLIDEVGKTLGELVGLLLSIGLVIGSFVVTGLAYGFPYTLVEAAGGNVYLVLLFGALAAFILGMGVPLIGVYIFLAITLAPALVTLGLNTMASHMFVFYWGMMASITPPVAITAFAAASLADADPIKTGLYSMRLAASKYLLPFMFVISPALILQTKFSESLLVIPSAIVGFLVISAAIEGYLWRIGSLTIVSRIVLVSAGILLSLPGLNTDYYGIGIFIVFIVTYILARGRSPIAKILVEAGNK